MSRWTAHLLKKSYVAFGLALGRLYTLSPKDTPEGVLVCATLADSGIRSTLGMLSNSNDRPVAIANEYRRASAALTGRAICGFYLALKPPALGFDDDLTHDLSVAAFANGHGIHFDSHGIDGVDQSLTLLDRIASRLVPSTIEGSHHRSLSITIPSRWKRSITDADWAIERQLRVRLVKGEFRATNPANETDPIDGYLHLIDRLAGRVPEIAIATHDDSLAQQAIARVPGSGTSILLELLYGFPIDRMVHVAHDTKTQVGFYVPYGPALLPYAMRHLLANPGKLSRGNYLGAFANTQSRLSRTVRLITSTDSPAVSPQK